MMQSLKTVTGSTRDLNNVHEITDLLAPNEPAKLYPSIERKAARWAVMDADTRLNDSSAGTERCTTSDHKRCLQCEDSLRTIRKWHLRSWRQVQMLTQSHMRNPVAKA